MAADITSTTIEFHRFGSEAQSMEKGKAYIRTCGRQKAAEEVTLGIEPKEIRRSLNRLRYNAGRTLELEAAAQQTLGKEAANFLPDSQILPPAGSALHQIDIVTHASELRAYPFEAIYASMPGASLESAETGTILTRRIRAEFQDAVPSWPEVPSILFVHAQIDHDLTHELVDRHRLALTEALAPWGRAQDLAPKGLLVVCEVKSVAELAEVRRRARFSHVHVLAHGAKVSEEDLGDSETEWGLRLGRAGCDAASPEAVAAALQPIEERPVVVTLAACDSGNPDRPELGNASLVESLHRGGIPVVVASQLPLTQPGSVTLTREFYRPLLSGVDVRIALHAARVALRQEAREYGERRHDWLSVVGYVRLPPEGYSEYLRAFSLRVQLRMLEAARKDTESLFIQTDPVRDSFEQVEARLNDRIQQLQVLKQTLSSDRHRSLQAECAGLLASAGKSLAELRFLQSRHFPDDRVRLEGLSRAALADACNWYAQCYKQNPVQHWHGIQKLALESALNGHCAEIELAFVRYVAENACEQDAHEYWACGTLVETILLQSIGSGRIDFTAAYAELDRLRDRAALNLMDQGFAAKSTRRQLERYVFWWTQGNGYFPLRSVDLSAAAAVLSTYIATGAKA